jgi:hypothetical protein
VDEKPNLVLASAIAAILAGTVMNHAIADQPCVLALSVAAAPVCSEKQPAHPHTELRQKIFEAPAVADEESFPLPLRTAAANLLASENAPRRRDFVQVEQQGRNHVLLDLRPTGPTSPDPVPLPDHVEPQNPETAHDPGSMVGQASARSSGYGTLGSYLSTAPQYAEPAQTAVWSPAQRGSLVVVITPPAGKIADRKELKAPAPPDQPHTDESHEDLFPTAAQPMPPADARPHFADDGYEDDSELYAA